MLSFPNVRLEYRPGKDLVLADTLSRSCPSGHDVDEDSDAMPTVCSNVFVSPEAQINVQKESREDEELSVVSRYILEGWPATRKQCAARALPFWTLRHDLSCFDDLVFYGSRLVVPSARRADVLDSLHAGHQGVTKTMLHAKSSVFWPGMRKRIEVFILRTVCKPRERV